MKLNIDAPFSMDIEIGAKGSAIRDDKGIFLLASSYGTVHVADAPTDEARALRDNLILAGQTGCNMITINSDCMNVMKIMNNGMSSSGPAATNYEECTFLDHIFFPISLLFIVLRKVMWWHMCLRPERMETYPLCGWVIRPILSSLYLQTM